MRKYTFNKLIRSKVLARMHEQGIIVIVEELDNAEYLIALKEKIMEEAKEVFEASSKNDLITELADVIEVIYSLAEAK